jgi:hypothetical protein
MEYTVNAKIGHLLQLAMEIILFSDLSVVVVYHIFLTRQTYNFCSVPWHLINCAGCSVEWSRHWITNYKGTVVAYFKSHYSIIMEELRASTKTSNIISGSMDVLKSGTSKIELRTAQSGNQVMWERQPVCINGYRTARYLDVAVVTLKTKSFIRSSFWDHNTDYYYYYYYRQECQLMEFYFHAPIHLHFSVLGVRASPPAGFFCILMCVRRFFLSDQLQRTREECSFV